MRRALILAGIVVALVVGVITRWPSSAPADVLDLVGGDRTKEGSVSAPQEMVRAIYITSTSAANPDRIDELIALATTTDINAVVIDVKDASGVIAYDVDDASLRRYGAVRPAIDDFPGLVERLHDAGLYVIARIVVFEDPVLAEARPGWGVQSAARLRAAGGIVSQATLWRDYRGLAWVDPATERSWRYTAALVRDTIAQGVDEINLDYIRFPSDGPLDDMTFVVWDGKTPRHTVIGRFLAFMKEQMPETTLSVDLFGLATLNRDDLGIGQAIEDAYDSVDVVAPMVYPSHYARGAFGFTNPAAHPYAVVRRSMEAAHRRLMNHPRWDEVELRPWLQDFDLGMDYDAAAVRAQMRAVRDAATIGLYTAEGVFGGFMFWNPRNVYTIEAFNAVHNESPDEM